MGRRGAHLRKKKKKKNKKKGKEKTWESMEVGLGAEGSASSKRAGSALKSSVFRVWGLGCGV